MHEAEEQSARSSPHPTHGEVTDERARDPTYVLLTVQTCQQTNLLMATLLRESWRL